MAIEILVIVIAPEKVIIAEGSDLEESEEDNKYENKY
jgi:hypothetical protein